MPLNTLTQLSTLNGTMSAVGVNGQSAASLAASLANGLIPAVQATPIQTADTGTVGVGVGTLPATLAAPLLASPALLISLLDSQLRAAGITGIMASSLATGVAVGLTAHLATGTVVTQHPTVGVGTAIGVWLPVPATYITLCLAALASGGIVGQYAQSLGLAVANAVVTFLSGIVFTIPIVGAPGPAPSAGVGVGFLV